MFKQSLISYFHTLPIGEKYMPFRVIPLDASYVNKEDIVIVLGRDIILGIIENPQSRALLEKESVKKLVSTVDLPRDDIRLLIDKLMTQDAYIFSPSLARKLLDAKGELQKLEPTIRTLNEMFQSVINSKFAKTYTRRMQKSIALEEEMPKELVPDLLFRVKGEADEKQIRAYEKELQLTDQELRAKIGFSLVVPSTLFVCPKCHVIVYAKEINEGKCVICGKELSIKTLKRISVYHVSDEIKEVWNSKLWFEAYLAELLKKIGFRTWVHVNVMGASGILHEIDVLAINRKNRTVIACECKTGKVSRGEIFNFCTKTDDLKSHISILALLGELPDPETRRFIQRKPAVIRLEKMGQISQHDALAELRQRLFLKG
jgi:rubrerythrin